MTDSPMERAVRALGQGLRIRAQRRGSQDGMPIADAFWRGIENANDVLARFALESLADLRTSDPDAFAAVLAECGHDCTAERKSLIAPHGWVVSEGEAVVEGRVVELEPYGAVGTGSGYHYHHLRPPKEAVAIYRVKPERSEQPTPAEEEALTRTPRHIGAFEGGGHDAG